MIVARIKMPLLSLAIGLTSFVAVSASAQDAGPIVIEGKRDANSRKICKSSAPPTGSRLGARRVCRTTFEWKVIEERSQRAVEREQMRSSAVDAYNQNAKNGLASQGPP